MTEPSARSSMPPATSPAAGAPIEGLCPQCASAIVLTGATVTCVVCGQRLDRTAPGSGSSTERLWDCVQALIAAELSPRAWRLVLTVALRTWGAEPDPLSVALGRRTDWLPCSVAELGQWSRQDRSHASKTLSTLAARGILWVSHSGPKTKAHRMVVRIAPLSAWLADSGPNRPQPLPATKDSGPNRPSADRLPHPTARRGSDPRVAPAAHGSLDGRPGAEMDARVDQFVTNYIGAWQRLYQTDQRPRTTQQDRRRLRSCLSGLDPAMDDLVLRACFTLSGPYWQGHSLAKLVTANGWNEALALAGQTARQHQWSSRRGRNVL